MLGAMSMTAGPTARPMATSARRITPAPLASARPTAAAQRASSAKGARSMGCRSSAVVCRAEAGPGSLPLVGNPAPNFEATAVQDQEFVDIKLSEYKARCLFGKYVVLFFYPLDFTFVCPTEITAFSDRYKEFAELNTEVLGVSVDSQFSHLAWIQTERKEGGVGDLAYPLVSDLKREISTKFGVLSADGVALRGLFIIDREGVIQHATINNLAFGRSVDEALRVLQALQYVQANPDEVCPAGWKPGDRTMNPTKSKEFFAAI